MAGLNKVLLIGNLGKEPEIKHLEGGHSRLTFPMATTEYYKNREGQKQEQTEWHTIVAWRGLADNLDKLQLKKGTMVYVEGRIRNRTVHDEKEGQKRSFVEINADIVSILKRPLSVEYTNGNNELKTLSPATEESGGTGDLPF